MTRARDQVITGWDLGAPEDWGALPLTRLDGSDAAASRARLRAAAGDLTSTDEARDRLERFLVSALDELLEDHLVLCAVWVPDPEAGIPQAVLKAELLVDADLAGFEALVAAADPPAGHERLHLEVLRTELPAGPAVVVDHQGVVDGTIEQYLQLCVFPDGTTDAVSLAFSTTALHLVEELATAAREIAESLTVVLGDPVGAQ